MIIRNIRSAAEEVGISAFITNAREKLDVQLNRLTGAKDLPIMLISWDLRFTLEFDNHGFINNPPVEVVALLLTKAEDKSKIEAERSSEQMAQLFIKFLQVLHDTQKPLMRTSVSPITNASMQMVPLYGMAQHSGVMGRFTIKAENKIPC